MKITAITLFCRMFGLRVLPFMPDYNIYKSCNLDGVAITFGTVIILSDKFLIWAGPEEIAAVLTHEKGHIVLKHRIGFLTKQQRHEREFQADAYTKKAGFGSALARVLAKYRCDETISHPSTEERLKRLLQ